MTDTRVYHAPWLETPLLANAIRTRFQDRGFETRVMPIPGGVAVQGTKSNWLQHGTAVTVKINKPGESVFVEVGTGKWGLNIAEGAAALVLFWPLAAIPAWAAYQCKTTMDDIWALVEGYVAQGRQAHQPAAPPVRRPRPAPRPAPAPAPGNQPVAPTPVRPNPPRRPTSVSPWACPACGAETRSGARFCSSCGHKLAD